MNTCGVSASSIWSFVYYYAWDEKYALIWIVPAAVVKRLSQLTKWNTKPCSTRVRLAALCGWGCLTIAFSQVEQGLVFHFVSWLNALIWIVPAAVVKRLSQLTKYKSICSQFHTCIYIYIYIYIHVYICICIYVYMYVCIYIYIYIYIYLYISMHVCVIIISYPRFLDVCFIIFSQLFRKSRPYAPTVAWYIHTYIHTHQKMSEYACV